MSSGKTEEPPQDVYIAEGSSLEGKLKTSGTVRVSGSLDGEIGCGTLIVTETGNVNGISSCKDAQIAGEVHQKLSVSRDLKIGNTGTVNGDLIYGMLTVEKGGRLNGSVKAKKPHISDDTREPKGASGAQKESKKDDRGLGKKKVANAD